MNDTPWKGSARFQHYGRNGYPATYEEMIKARSLGAQALDANRPPSDCPYRPAPNATPRQREKAEFLADVWTNGWKLRRQQILAWQRRNRQQPSTDESSNPEP